MQNTAEVIAAAPELPAAMTVKEFCARTRTGKSNVYRLIRGGKLVARKIGNKTIILESDYVAFINSLPPMPSRHAVRMV